MICSSIGEIPMEQRRWTTSANQSSIPSTLGDEEEVWYRHQTDPQTLSSIHHAVYKRQMVILHLGNPLAEDEDAWARR